MTAVFGLLVMIGMGVPAIAVEDSDGNPSGASGGKEQAASQEPTEVVVTQHRLKVAGGELNYTARVGKMAVRDNQGEVQGHIFFTAYELNEPPNRPRPLTFAFNGGPGAGSIWLHMGGLGPKRVSLKDERGPPPPPVGYLPNEYTWLRFTDLVFVDPIGTGFSRSTLSSQKTTSRFYGVKQDITYLAGFIHDYLNQYSDWLRPLFLAGESYGATRAAGLPIELIEEYGIRINGLVLISTVLDFETIVLRAPNELTYLLSLPTYAASAHFHEQLPEALQGLTLEQLLEDTETFCLDRYSSLLVKGDSLSAAEKEFLTQQLSRRTGLPSEMVQRYNYRLPPYLVIKHLLQKPGHLIGRMDTTIMGIDPEPTSPYPVYDPSLEPFFAPFTMAFNAYLEGELGYQTDQNYEFLNQEVSRKWDWESGLQHGQGYVSVSDSLQQAMAVDPYLQVFVAAGIYDLAIPYFSAKYTLNHLFVPDRTERIQMRVYPSGHMIYNNLDALKGLTADAERFLGRAMGVSGTDR